MLQEDLKKSLKGEVRFDAGAKALYATDASNYRQVPMGVVFPKDAADTSRTFASLKSKEIAVYVFKSGLRTQE